MSNPRQTLPGQTLHVVRRTSERRFLMAPSRAMEALQQFGFAYAIEQSGQIPHADVFMLNHNHAENTDPNQKRSVYSEKLHGFLGRYGNKLCRRTGHFWDNRRTSETVLLHDPEEPSLDVDEVEAIIDDVLREITLEEDLDIHQFFALYIWMNPISANLVDQIRQWPGHKVLPDDWGKKRTFQRPEGVSELYPPEASYVAMPPPGKWSDMPLEDAIADANRLIEKAEGLYRTKRHAEGKRVLGPKAVRGQRSSDRPLDSNKARRNRRKPTPMFAGRRELRRKASLAYTKFRERHKIAWRRQRHGHDGVVFPAGSVGMHRLAGVKCRPRPRPDEDPMP